MDALIGVERLLEEKGTTPESGGEARILIGLGRDTPRTAGPPLPSFTTPTPVHDGEPRPLPRDERSFHGGELTGTRGSRLSGWRSRISIKRSPGD